MVTYLGLNFPVELSDEYTEQDVEIDIVFSDERNRQTVKKKHLNTKFIYEISMRGEPIWHMNEYYKQNERQIYNDAKLTFLQVVQLLNDLLPKGDFCELYICWLAEEEEQQEGSLNIQLGDIPINTVDIFEKCHIRLEN